jgi:hypothetical protein
MLTKLVGKSVAKLEEEERAVESDKNERGIKLLSESKKRNPFHIS